MILATVSLAHLALKEVQASPNSMVCNGSQGHTRSFILVRAMVLTSFTVSEIVRCKGRKSIFHTSLLFDFLALSIPWMQLTFQKTNKGSLGDEGDA